MTPSSIGEDHLQRGGLKMVVFSQPTLQMLMLSLCQCNYFIAIIKCHLNNLRNAKGKKSPQKPKGRLNVEVETQNRAGIFWSVAGRAMGQPLGTRLRWHCGKEQTPMTAKMSPGWTWAPGGFCKHAVPGDWLQFRGAFKNSHSMNVPSFRTGGCGPGCLLQGWGLSGTEGLGCGCFLLVTMNSPISAGTHRASSCGPDPRGS